MPNLKKNMVGGQTEAKLWAANGSDRLWNSLRKRIRWTNKREENESVWIKSQKFSKDRCSKTQFLHCESIYFPKYPKESRSRQTMNTWIIVQVWRVFLYVSFFVYWPLESINMNLIRLQLLFSLKDPDYRLLTATFSFHSGRVNLCFVHRAANDCRPM